MSRRRAYVPKNSTGQPWKPGQTWRCTRCGETGPDRDDVPFSNCSRAYPPHELQFEPPEHHAAVIARNTRGEILVPGTLVPLVLCHCGVAGCEGWRCKECATHSGCLCEERAQERARLEAEGDGRDDAADRDAQRAQEIDVEVRAIRAGGM